MSAARIKQIDKEKNDLLKRVDPLIAKKKRLYSNMDITSAKLPEEKQLEKEIAALFSKVNALNREKRKLINFGTMPIKKKTPAKKATAKKATALGPKAKLMKLQVTTLRNKAKKLGISNLTTRTKENLAQSIMLAEARKKRGTTAGKRATAKRKAVTLKEAGSHQTGKSDFSKDYARWAELPGKRTTEWGTTYYEHRKNRSDADGSFTGNGYTIEERILLTLQNIKAQHNVAFWDDIEKLQRAVDYLKEGIPLTHQFEYYS